MILNIMSSKKLTKDLNLNYSMYEVRIPLFFA
jgi:hypothetical protein